MYCTKSAGIRYMTEMFMVEMFCSSDQTEKRFILGQEDTSVDAAAFFEPNIIHSPYRCLAVTCSWSRL